MSSENQDLKRINQILDDLGILPGKTVERLECFIRQHKKAEAASLSLEISLEEFLTSAHDNKHIDDGNFVPSGVYRKVDLILFNYKRKRP